MKKFLTSAILLALFTAGATLSAQPQQDEYLGLPGDNLNLYAVMKLFQGSQTLEGFERSLNDQNNRINNLDLNGDNLIDYIRVVDYIDGNVHNIVLQDVINYRETQDVAVFTVQRLNNGEVQIQLIGDEALYGQNYIIEPITDQYASQTPNPGYSGYTAWNGPVVRTTYYEIAGWPLIRFIYMPGYVVWRSSWHWGYYPEYWHPWKPFYWDYYYGYHYHSYDNYYSHYRRWNTPRYTHWNDFYYSHRRSFSPTVNVRIKSGNYRTTYSHPDQRSKGEALFAKTHPDQVNRRSVNSPANGSTGRTNMGANKIRQPAGSDYSTTRRSSSPTTTRENYNAPSNRGKSQGTAASGRSASPATARPATPPANSYNSQSQKRSVTNTKAVQGNTRNNSSGKTSAATAGSSRRSSSGSKDVKTSGNNADKKTTEPAKNNRRK
jgi:hypothetical protein